MAKTGKVRLPKESELVLLAKRWDKQVAVSPAAEKGRVEGCLCIHTDPVSGKILMCGRMKNNLSQTDDIGKKFLQEAAKVELALLFARSNADVSIFDNLKEDDPCPLALILYELSKAAPAEISVSICAGYVPPEEQAMLNVIEIKRRGE